MRLYVDPELGYVSYAIPVVDVEKQIQPFLDHHQAYIPEPLPDLSSDDPDHWSRIPREFTPQSVEGYHISLLPSSFGKVALGQAVHLKPDGSSSSRFDRIVESLANIREPEIMLSSLTRVIAHKIVTNPEDLIPEASKRFSSGQQYWRESIVAEVEDVDFRRAIGDVYRKFGLCRYDDEPYVHVTVMHRQDSDLRRKGVSLPLRSSLTQRGIRTEVLGVG